MERGATQSSINTVQANKYIRKRVKRQDIDTVKISSVQ